MGDALQAVADLWGEEPGWVVTGVVLSVALVVEMRAEWRWRREKREDELRRQDAWWRMFGGGRPRPRHRRRRG